ncbi:MAG: septum formation inhibitor Maf [Luteolibacter sp.]
MKRFLLPFFFTLPLQADPIRDFWFNGAEISSFELSQSRYGKNHPGHAELIFVTEPFLIAEQVKNESGKPGSTDVLKLNALTTFNTGIYSYRTMTSTFRPIDLEKFPHALKSNTSVQDWCGQAFQQYNLRGDGWSVQLRSYFEQEADKDFTLPCTYLEDELWITLRLDPKKLPTGETQIIPGAIFTRFAHKEIEASTAQAELKQSEETSTYSLSYPSLKRTLAISFDTAFPHIIRKWTETTPTGTTTATLKKRLMNVAYWGMHNPEDAEKRKELGLQPVAD